MHTRSSPVIDALQSPVTPHPKRMMAQEEVASG